MKGNNPARDLSKNAGGTTPVTYRSVGAVYRSLAAVPVQLDLEKQFAARDKQFSSAKGELFQSHSKSNINPVVKKEEPPLPIPLIIASSPHKSLFLESNPVSNVIEAVNDLFEQHHVDAEFNEAKFKWKCACYDSQTETNFVCRLFSVPDKPNYFVLNFQRRSGDPFHFQSVYKAINFKLLKSGFVVPCGDQKSAVEPEMRTFRPMTLPEEFFGVEEGDEEKDAKEYEPLCKMCLSNFVDVQREGLIALANHADQSDFARKSLAPFAEKLVETLSLSRDTQVRRLAASALAAISKDPTSHHFLKEKGGLRILAGVFLNDSELLETRRQAGKTLQNVSDWDPDTKANIKRASIATDARLVRLMQDLRSLLV